MVSDKTHIKAVKKMEIQIVFLASGILIVIVAIFRLRNLPSFGYLQKRLEETYDVSDIDLSGNIEYTNCYAQEWVYENTMRRKHSAVGLVFQQHLMNSTLIAALWIGLFMGIISMIIGFLFIEGMMTIGAAVIIIAVGLIIVVGPGEPRVSEDLLEAMLSVEYQRLCKNDYAYVTVAINAIRKWGAISLILGFLFLILAPVGDLVPTSLALILAVFSDVLLWGPAFFLAEISVLYALLYLAAVIPTMIAIVVKLVGILMGRFSGTSNIDEEFDYDEF